MRDIDRVADKGMGAATVGRVSVLVNGGGNGFFERQAFVVVIGAYLGDEVFSGEARLVSPPKSQAVVVVDMENVKV